jgi:hypothetical protein
LFAGTSTGAIQACCLASGRYSAAEISQFYTEHGNTIFPPANSLLKWGRWWLGAKHDHRPLEGLLQKFLIDADGKVLTMQDAVKPVICETFEWSSDRPIRLSNWEHPGMPMWVACRASSAAPTYFRPADVSLNGQEPVCLIDGGMDCNNPGVDAFAHLVLTDHVPDSDIAVISIGTGRPRRFTSTREIMGMRLIQMLPKIFNTAMSTERTSQQLRVLGDRYVEIDCDLPDGISAAMDDGSPEQMQSLAQVAAAHISRHPEQFDRAVGLLEKSR